MPNYKKKYKRLKKLLTQWTRAEVMARIGQFDNLEYTDYAMTEVALRNKIRKKLFGSSDLAKLGIKWGLIKRNKK